MHATMYLKAMLEREVRNMFYSSLLSVSVRRILLITILVCNTKWMNSAHIIVWLCDLQYLTGDLHTSVLYFPINLLMACTLDRSINVI